MDVARTKLMRIEIARMGHLIITLTRTETVSLLYLHTIMICWIQMFTHYLLQFTAVFILLQFNDVVDKNKQK